MPSSERDALRRRAVALVTELGRTPRDDPRFSTRVQALGLLIPLLDEAGCREHAEYLLASMRAAPNWDTRWEISQLVELTPKVERLTAIRCREQFLSAVEERKRGTLFPDGLKGIAACAGRADARDDAEGLQTAYRAVLAQETYAREKDYDGTLQSALLALEAAMPGGVRKERLARRIREQFDEVARSASLGTPVFSAAERAVLADATLLTELLNHPACVGKYRGEVLLRATDLLAPPRWPLPALPCALLPSMLHNGLCEVVRRVDRRFATPWDAASALAGEFYRGSRP
jgi:hypothetical protein